MTYNEKIRELQKQAVSIIQRGLENHEAAVSFVYACQLLAWSPPSSLDAELTEDDELDAQIITVKSAAHNWSK